MLTPNLYTLDAPDGIYGLHQFRDGKQPAMILKQHSCGDWQTVRPPTPSEVEHFEKWGSRVTQPRHSTIDTVPVVLPVRDSGSA